MAALVAARTADLQIETHGARPRRPRVGGHKGYNKARFPDMTARDAAWAVFQAHPERRQLAGDDYFADIVSSITDEILRPN